MSSKRTRKVGQTSDMIASGLADLGRAMASTIGQAKKKKKKKPSPPPSRSAMVTSGKSAVLAAPQSYGTVVKSRNRTPVFSIPFSTVLVQLQTGLTGAVQFAAVGSTTTGPVLTTPIGVSLTATPGLAFPVCFPPQVTRLGQSFSRYRLKPGSARLSYRGSVSSSAPGSLAIAVLPSEDPIASATPSYQIVAGSECAVITPVWAPCVEFPIRNLESVINTGPEWKYCDFDGNVSQPEIRQDVLFNLTCSSLGMAQNNIFGFMFLEGILEFQHLQDNLSQVNVAVPRPLPPSGDEKEDRDDD